MSDYTVGVNASFPGPSLAHLGTNRPRYYHLPAFDIDNLTAFVKNYLNRGVASGTPTQTKKGPSGSFQRSALCEKTKDRSRTEKQNASTAKAKTAVKKLKSAKATNKKKSAAKILAAKKVAKPKIPAKKTLKVKWVVSKPQLKKAALKTK